VTDERERELERQAAESPDAFYRLARTQLRRKRNLGQLHQYQWDALIRGAAKHGEFVYVVGVSRDPRNVLVEKLVSVTPTATGGSVIQSRDIVFNVGDVNYGPSGQRRWFDYRQSRPSLNIFAVTRGSRVVIIKRDLENTTAVGIVRSLGIEDMFESIEAQEGEKWQHLIE
jgi:hypothetical protein